MSQSPLLGTLHAPAYITLTTILSKCYSVITKPFFLRGKASLRKVMSLFVEPDPSDLKSFPLKPNAYYVSSCSF